jgi:hypothetical protein
MEMRWDEERIPNRDSRRIMVMGEVGLRGGGRVTELWTQRRSVECQVSSVRCQVKRQVSSGEPHRVVDDGGEAEAIEDLNARLPHARCAVPVHTRHTHAADKSRQPLERTQACHVCHTHRPSLRGRHRRGLRARARVGSAQPRRGDAHAACTRTPSRAAAMRVPPPPPRRLPHPSSAAVRAAVKSRHVALLFEALVVEAVDLRDLPRLVVAADEGDALRVAHLTRRRTARGDGRARVSARAQTKHARRRSERRAPPAPPPPELHSSLAPRLPRTAGGARGGARAGARRWARSRCGGCRPRVAPTLSASSSRKVSTE